MKYYLSVFVLVLLCISFSRVVFCSGEFDAETVVSSVTDGDTFYTTTEGTVRLADINCPEYYEDGGRRQQIIQIRQLTARQFFWTLMTNTDMMRKMVRKEKEIDWFVWFMWNIIRHTI